jgi:hypothetical protein
VCQLNSSILNPSCFQLENTTLAGHSTADTIIDVQCTDCSNFTVVDEDFLLGAAVMRVTRGWLQTRDLGFEGLHGSSDLDSVFTVSTPGAVSLSRVSFTGFRGGAAFKAVRVPLCGGGGGGGGVVWWCSDQPIVFDCQVSVSDNAVTGPSVQLLDVTVHNHTSAKNGHVVLLNQVSTGSRVQGLYFRDILVPELASLDGGQTTTMASPLQVGVTTNFTGPLTIADVSFVNTQRVLVSRVFHSVVLVVSKVQRVCLDRMLFKRKPPSGVRASPSPLLSRFAIELRIHVLCIQ